MVCELGTQRNGLEIAERLDIAIDVAHAIAYLHMYTGIHSPLFSIQFEVIAPYNFHCLILSEPFQVIDHSECILNFAHCIDRYSYNP